MIAKFYFKMQTNNKCFEKLEKRFQRKFDFMVLQFVITSLMGCQKNMTKVNVSNKYEKL